VSFTYGNDTIIYPSFPPSSTTETTEALYPSLPPSSTMGTTGAFILVAILLHPMYNNNGILGGHHLVKMELILSGGKVDHSVQEAATNGGIVHEPF
jgi:hypothetical protein